MKDKSRHTAKNNTTVNILLSGVGGQGIIIAGTILTEVAMKAGMDVKKSEVHGMSQRGGTVVSQVRYGEKIHSPLIQKGKADIILAFEKLESVRFLECLKPGGFVIYNSVEIIPLTVYSSDVQYPKDIKTICREKTDKVFSVHASDYLKPLGNGKILNTIMLGVLSQFLEFDEDIWLDTIISRVPPQTVDANRKAFEVGREINVGKSLL